MDYFELCKLKLNGTALVVERFYYDYGFDIIGNQKKEFKVVVPLGFNKNENGCDGYPLFHNLLISKDKFNLVLEVELNGEWVVFAEFINCVVLNKSCVSDPFVSFEFKGKFEKLIEYNEDLLNIRGD